MRLKSLLIAGFGLLTLAIASPEPASAFHWDRPNQPRGWDNMRTVRHWVYYPRYNHVYLRHGATDRYAYQYSPRGYYPYYNSNYWRPAYKVHRHHNHLPPYYAAWGSPKRGYRHVQWHRRHHGAHHRSDW